MKNKIYITKGKEFKKLDEAKLIEKIYEGIFKLNNDDLLLHYNEVVKELEKRGITTCSTL